MKSVIVFSAVVCLFISSVVSVVASSGSNETVLLSEDWSSGSFVTNNWTVDDNQWYVSEMNPWADYNWSFATNYNSSMTSKTLAGEGYDSVWLDYDLKYLNWSSATVEQFAVKVWDGAGWQQVALYNNQGGSFDWIHENIDISAYASNDLRIQYTAFGLNAENIQHWFIDNIKIVGMFVPEPIEWVTVGNPGNAGEQSRLDYDDPTYYGGVEYEYQIGKYEITAGQYCEFLNAVATDAMSDLHGVYNDNMMGDYGCKIQRLYSSPNYTYSVAPDWANRPVNYVNWYCALRFCNWLHNGQPTGVQDGTTTEDGAYDMSLGASVVRKPGARVWLPSENEWYKAAYHKNDGVTGNYFDYPTSSDTEPGIDLNEATNPGNNANHTYNLGTYVIGPPYYRTPIGEFELSASPYGTFDQGGNVFEWVETPLFDYPTYRGTHGGAFSSSVFFLTFEAGWGDAPNNYSHDTGFRVAAVPCPSADLTDDCFVDLDDLAVLVSEWLMGIPNY